MLHRYAFPGKHVHNEDDLRTSKESSSSGTRYPLLYFQLRIRRRVDTYIRNTCLPIFAITACASCTFFDYSHTSITNSVLSIVGFKHLVLEHMPSGCQTQLEKYIDLSFGAVKSPFCRIRRSGTSRSTR